MQHEERLSAGSDVLGHEEAADGAELGLQSRPGNGLRSERVVELPGLAGVEVENGRDGVRRD